MANGTNGNIQQLATSAVQNFATPIMLMIIAGLVGFFGSTTYSTAVDNSREITTIKAQINGISMSFSDIIRRQNRANDRLDDVQRRLDIIETQVMERLPPRR